MGGSLDTLLHRAGHTLPSLVSMRPGTVCCVLLLACLAAGQDEELKGKPKPKPPKGACKNTGQKPSDKLFKPYTIPIKNKKCPCWWDMSKKVCACCKGDNVMQCGWPMHRYCYKKSNMGCPGVCNNKYTLSGRGFPCYNDPSKGNNCAVCAPGAFQCYADSKTGPNSKEGSRCSSQKDQKYCSSVQGDCQHIPGACPVENCEFQGKVNKFLSHSQCTCPEGYEGNGMQCYSNGTLLADPAIQVELQMEITSEEYEFPFTGEGFSSSAELESLITEMGSVESGCTTGPCQATFNQTETEV